MRDINYGTVFHLCCQKHTEKNPEPVFSRQKAQFFVSALVKPVMKKTLDSSSKSGYFKYGQGNPQSLDYFLCSRSVG